MFCCGSCSERKNIHQLECCSVVHMIRDTTLKLSIHTVLMAIEMFVSVEKLMKFVERTLNEPNVPKLAKDSMSRYGIFLKLTQSNEHIYPCYQVYTTLMAIPNVKNIFNTEQKQRFLMHLTLHHIAVIPKNSFQHERFNRDWIRSDYIYDIMSLINHSCIPNVFNYSTSDEIGHCITVKPIKKDEQIFINYVSIVRKHLFR